jgi:predicted nucleic acid-binding protein
MLVDTAVWVDHLRRGDEALVGLLEQSQVSVHPFVIGELACGHLADREMVLEALHTLPMVPVVDHADVIDFVGRQQLMGRGLGWIDMHLLAAASAAGERLMTPDRRLHEAARELGLT